VVTAEAAEMLAGEYAGIRQQAEGTARERQAAAQGKEGTNTGSKVPITVRQLEALVRVTEAVAKASLSREATLEHVKEALALFKRSTLAAANNGNGMGDVLSGDQLARVRACEGKVLRIVGPGQTLPVAHIKNQLRQQGFDEGIINTALRVMDSRGEVSGVEAAPPPLLQSFKCLRPSRALLLTPPHPIHTHTLSLSLSRLPL
jgi:DNA replication licensing factor MCM5